MKPLISLCGMRTGATGDSLGVSLRPDGFTTGLGLRRLVGEEGDGRW